MHTHRLRVLVTAALAVTALIACAPAQRPTTPSGQARAAVSVALDYLPNTNHTGVFVAQQQGWYAAEGLDTTVLPYVEGTAAEVLVAAGQADVAFSFEEAVTVARAAGQPIVSLAAVIQKNTSAFVALQESGLDRPAKLEGRRYAGFGLPFEDAVIEAVVTCDGGPTGKVQNITTSTGALQAVQAKQADFAWIFLGWEGIAARREGITLNAMPLPESCIPNYYTPVLVTSEAAIRDRGDALRRFMRATSRGYEHAIANPAEAADLLLQAAPRGSFPDPDLVRESAQWLAPRYKEGKARWGEQDLQVWTDYPRFMVRSGLLQDAAGRPVTQEPDYARFFTNDFLP